MRLVPIAAATWIGAYLGISFPGQWVLVIIAIAALFFFILLFSAWRGGRMWILSALVACASILVSSLLATNLSSSFPADKIASGHFMTVEATITSPITIFAGREGRPTRGKLRVSLREVEVNGYHWHGNLPAVLVINSPDETTKNLEVGSRISCQAVGSRVERRRYSVGEITLKSGIEIVSSPPIHHRWANHFRNSLIEAMAWSPDGQAALVPSLVVGDTSRLSQEVIQSFRDTGLTHLTAVSGTNLTLMILFGVTAAKYCSLRGWSLRILALIITCAFVLICHAEPSVIRAAAMGMIALGATGISSDEGRSIRHLALAVFILLLINPWLATSWGFALSVSACLGILLWAKRWQRILSRYCPPLIADAICLPLAAQIATQPLVTALSGSISMVAVGANMVAAPFVGPVTVLGIAAALVSLIWPWGGRCIGYLAGWFAQPIISLARWGASLPSATIAYGDDRVQLGILALVCWLGGGLIVPMILARRWRVIALAVIVLIAVMRPSLPTIFHRDWSIVFCDIGQGGAQLIRVSDRSAILVDTGPDPQLLSRCLHRNHVERIDLLVITHSHADHVGGLAAIDPPSTQMVFVADEYNRDFVIQRSPALAEKIHIAHPGDQWKGGDVTWTTLAAGPLHGESGREAPSDSGAENDLSVVGYVQSGQITLLLTGDLEEDGQRRTMEALQGRPVDIFHVPHHGSSHHLAEFFTFVHAPISVIQVGKGNEYGHPAPSTIRDLNASGTQIYRTDEQGQITISSDGRHIVTDH